MSSRFDLEKAVAAWRRSLEYNPALLREDVDELESHVRDQVRGLVLRGLSEEEAFERAVRQMGSYGKVESEYQKVYWGKVRRRHELAHEINGRAAMFKNYLKIAWRNVLREKGYAFINVFGLAVGIAFCTLIFLYVRDELTYDHFHTNADRIFRVRETTLGSTQSGGDASGPIILGPALQADVPGIAHYVRLQSENHYVRTPGASVEAIEESVLFADPAILNVFTFPLRQGDPATALADPGNVVLTETMARKYFGNEDALGKTLQIRLDQTFESFTVSGIAADVPGNSTIQFGILLSFEQLFLYSEFYSDWAESWHFYSPQTYVALMPENTEQQVEASLPAFHRKYHEDDIAEAIEEGSYDSTVVETYDLQPIREIHLTSNSDPVYSYILSGIALAVLLIACINFMTLSIGRSARRAREVGVRKVVGAQRKQIMAQFWGEAFLLSTIALFAGLVLAFIFMPVFNNLTDKDLQFSLAGDWTVGAALAGLVILTGLVAGSYPALVLSRFNPIETLKDRLRLGKTSGFARSLVVLQFAFTVFLITSTLVMARQLAYTRSMDLGFDKEQIVVIPASGLDASRIAERFRMELERQPSIVGVTASGNMLGQTGNSGYGYRLDGKAHAVNVFRVDTHYLDFLGLELVAGRNFNPDLATDSTHAVIVNEGLVRDFALEDPLGKPIPNPFEDEASPVIVGIVKDYHFQSLYKEVGSVMLTLDPEWDYANLLVRIRPENIPQTLDLLRTTWRATVPDVPFTYQFLDDQMQAQYANDQRWSQIVQYAALFAILIACLGLLGLAALSVTRRTKEIGIRKVLGATVAHLVTLISKEFALLVVVGVVLASPAAYLVMQRWLQDFAYRAPLSWWVFAAAGLTALVVALLTVGYHAVKSALADPVKSLRYE
jgi:putative ABC transport system permease protein